MMSEVKNIPKSHLQEEVSFRGLQELTVDSVHINKNRYFEMFFFFYGEDGGAMPRETARK